MVNDTDLTLTQYEEVIYNTHLRISRSQKNQPCKLRKDFSNIDDYTKVTLKKISFFLKKHTFIELNDFITAPYKIYADEDYFDLKFYTTQKAIKAYGVYCFKRNNEDVDSTIQLQFIINSLKYIQVFCIENGITLNDYLTHTSKQTPDFLLHIREHKVSVLTLLGLKDFHKRLYAQDSELVQFIIGKPLYDIIPMLKNKLYSSKKALKLITIGLNKINEKINKNKVDF